MCKIIKWLQITKKLEINEYDEPFVDDNGDTKYWIKVADRGRTHTTSYDNTLELFDFDIFDIYLEESVIKEFNFTCDKIYESHKTIMTNTAVGYEIIDYYGERKYFGFRDWKSENIIIRCIKEMKSYASSKSWREVDLKVIITEKDDEIKELNEELKIQRKKAKVLRKKLKELK